MNRIKRIIVTWLSVAMIINSMPLPVFANEADMAHMPELTEFSEILGVEENTSEGELLAETPAAEETELEAASANEGGSVGAEYINGDLAQSSETVIDFQVDDETVETTGEVTGTGAENDPWVVDTWAELKDKMTSSGHIKLNDNIRPEDPANSGCLEVPTSTVVTLDLNGKTIDRGLAEKEAVENGNVIIVSGNLTLKDGIDDKTGTITGGYPKNGYGGGVRVDENGSFTMDGGIISGNQTQDYWAGGGVYVNENGTFTMNDGTICNNKAQGGGGVCIRYADFTMNGGTICHNRAHSDQHNNGEGGGISVEGGPDRSASFTMNSGAINSNTADTSGGGVFMCAGSEFTMTDGEINGNTLINQNVQSGGGVYINGEKHAGSTTFTMSGGRICGNSAYEGGGVIVTSYGTFTMTGGVISGNCVTEGYDHQAKGGGVYVCSPTSLDLGGTFNVSGSPVIKGNTKGGDANNIIGTIYNNKINVIGKLTDTAELWVNGAEDNEIAQGLDYTITNGDAGKFVSDDGNCVGVLEGSKVVLKKKITWTELQTLLDSASTIPEDPTKIRMNWDVTAGGSDNGLDVKGNTYVELDLNGHTIDRGLANVSSESSGYVIIVEENASLSVCDNSDGQEGRITGGNTTFNGGGVYVEGGTFSLKGGSISGNKAEITGGGVYIDNGSFTMTSGSIFDNKASNGGGVHIGGDGNFRLKGGSISGNTATNEGGGVYVGYNGNFRMEGGSIIGNTANYIAGGVYVTNGGTLAMEGGSITGNTSYDNGGGVYVTDGGTLTMSGNAVLNRNTARSNGGGVYVRGSLTMSDNAVLNGNTTYASGGGVYVYGGTLTMEGGSITGNTAANGNGGGVYVENGTLSMNGGNITGNDADEFGGGVYVENGTLSMKGGSITGNKAASSGGGVYVRTNTYFMTGGNFELSGSPVITGNVKGGSIVNGLLSGGEANNVYFLSGNKIRIIGEMTNTIPVGVTVEPAPEGDEKIDFTTNWKTYMNEDSPVGYFSSDDRGCSVIYNKTTDHGEAALTGHIHNFTYTANGATITATCSNSDGKCSLPDHKASITIKAPERDLTYDGTEKAATITGDTAVLDTPEIAYKCGDTPRGDAPKYAENAAYTASVTLEGVTASVSYTIEKKPVTITGLSAENKNYDGDTVAEVKGTASVNGVIDADRRYVSVSPGRAAFTDPNAGTGKTVKFSGWSIDGESAFNYKLSSQPADVTADIEKAVLPDKTVSGNAKYGLTGTLELRPYIADGGRLGTDILVLDDSMILAERPTISGTVLSYGFRSVSENVGKTATVTVSVNEAINYKDYMIKATLEVIDCDHPSRVLTDVKKATCTDKGYTGNYKCTECGGILEYGHETPVDPDNHDYDYSNGKVTKEPTAFTMGEHTYYCRHDHSHKITKQDIAQLPAKDGGDYSDFVNDTKGLSVNSAPPTTDDKGNEVTKITVGGEEVSKITYDPKSGKETIESKVWITGLLKEYTYTGSAIKPEFHVYDGAKRLTEKTDYTVSWAKNKDVGTATITIKFKGNYKDTKSETVTFGIKAAELGKDIIAHEIAIAAKKSGSTKVTPVLTWAKTGKTVSNKYFTVTPDSVKGDVTTTATIMVKGGQNNYSGTTTVNLRAVADKNKMLPNSKVKFDQKSYAYTGRPVTPKYDVTFGSQALKENVDYKCVSLCNNINPGTATIVFEAVSGNKSGYVGTKTATFKISGKIELKEEGSGSPFTYTVADASGVPYAKGGTKPPVTVRNNTLGTELKEGVDYTLSYSKNKAVTNGNKTAEVKVKGKGNYKGTVILKFAIAKQRLDEDGINIVIKDQFTTKDKLKKPSITVTDIDGKKLKENTDYVISSIDDSVTGNTDTEGVVNVTIKGKGAYNENVPRKVSFRYKSDKSSDISKAKEDKIAEQIYTGNQVKLSNEDFKEIVYTGSGTAKHYLVPGTDFEITGYTNNIKKGTAKVTIKGMNAYAGTKTLSFKIVQKSVDYKGDLTGGN